MLNWIVWNKTVFDIETVITKLIELIISIKMDLALPMKGWYAIKPKQTTNRLFSVNLILIESSIIRALCHNKA